MFVRRKKTKKVANRRTTVVPKTLGELDLDDSNETNELMDPVSLRLLIIPLKPSSSSRLQAIELASLFRQLRFNQNRRSSFHPLDCNLILTEESLKNYILDDSILKRRDAFLMRHGYSLDAFLSYRGLTRGEYQKLLRFFQNRWLSRIAEYSLFTLVSAAGIGAYLYGNVPQSLFFSFADSKELLAPYRKLQGVAGSVSVLNTLCANLAWNKNNNAGETVAITGVGFLVSILLLFGEVLILSELEQGQSSRRLSDEEPLWVISFMLAKLALPFLQGSLIAVGRSALQQVSLFSREPALVQDYVARKPLEFQPEPEPALAEKAGYCGIM